MMRTCYLQKGVIVGISASARPCGGQQGRFAAAVARTEGGNGRRIYPEFDGASLRFFL